MFTRGSLHKRQSEGNNAANKFSDNTPAAEIKNGNTLPRRDSVPVPAARISSLLLLKTSLHSG